MQTEHEKVHEIIDRHRLQNEVDPGIKGYVVYTLTVKLGTNAYTAKIAATNSTHTYTSGGTSYVYYAHAEYWSFPTSNYSQFHSPATGSTLVISQGGEQDWGTGGISGFPVSGGSYTAAMGNATNGDFWIKQMTNPTSVFYWTNPTSNPTSGYALSFSSLSYDSTHNTWSGDVQWWVIGTGVPSGYILTSNMTTTTLNFGTPPTPATGYNWYFGQPLATVNLA